MWTNPPLLMNNIRQNQEKRCYGNYFLCDQTHHCCWIISCKIKKRYLAPSEFRPSTKISFLTFYLSYKSDAGTGGGGGGGGGGAGGATGYPIFGSSVNPNSTGRADYPNLLLLAPSIFFTFRHHCSASEFMPYVICYGS